MSLPNRKYDVDTFPPLIGTEFMKYGENRINELLANSDTNSKFLPKTIAFEDLDQAIFNFISEDGLKLVIDGKIVPAFFVENDRWGEYSKTWKFMDNDKNVPTPYITVRRIDKQKGTRLGNKMNIPQLKTFIYYNIPIIDNGQQVYLIYKTPEPTNVDLTYEVTLFTKYRVDVNSFDEVIFTNFSSIQAYVFPKGHPMPILTDTTSEANTIENIDGDKFLASKYTFKLMGYIQDEENFEVKKSLRKPRFGYFIE